MRGVDVRLDELARTALFSSTQVGKCDAAVAFEKERHEVMMWTSVAKHGPALGWLSPHTE